MVGDGPVNKYGTSPDHNAYRTRELITGAAPPPLTAAPDMQLQSNPRTLVSKFLK